MSDIVPNEKNARSILIEIQQRNHPSRGEIPASATGKFRSAQRSSILALPMPSSIIHGYRVTGLT